MLTTMTADDLIRAVTWTLFTVIALRSALHAIRRPTRANLEIALFFGLCLFIILVSVLNLTDRPDLNPVTISVVSTALLALPYVLFRLIDDVIGVPSILAHGVSLGFVLSVVVVWALPQNRPPWLDSLLLLGLVAVLAYVVTASVREAFRTRGVTKRRLAAVSFGSLCLALNFIAGNLPRWIPISAADARVLADVFGLITGVSYYIGFAPPAWLRRTWQEPELRAFLKQAAQLPRLPDTAAIVSALEQGAKGSLGAPYARIGLWSEQRQLLRFSTPGGPLDVPATSDMPAALAFRSQQVLFSPDTHYEPGIDKRFRFRQIARAVLAAPITAGEQRLGVLAVSAARAPIFADDDLALVQLLADQAAVILESRQLIDEAAHVQAREAATRLKDDFLSAAAHDLKTPLTTLVAQAQLLERRADRNPQAPVDREGLRRLTRESERLRTMVLELLDAARAEQGQLVAHSEAVDLAVVAREVVQRYHTLLHPCVVEAPGQLVGFYDAGRIRQLLENLVENAVKYSPDGGAVELALWSDDAGMHIRVRDHGIGIPHDDLPRLFDRFHRGTNVDDRRFPGMGLGLYICHSIVVQHGGTIVVTSEQGQGSAFHITLPSTSVGAEVELADHTDYRR